MDELVTAVVVVTDNSDTLLRFGKTTLCNTPEAYPKIIVDNTPYPAPYVQEILSHWARTIPNVTLLFNRQDLSPYPQHADALDLALEFVHTSHLATFDYDFFLEDPQFWPDIALRQQQTDAVVIGDCISKFADYAHPFAALYSAATARQFRFAKRARPAHWMTYVQDSEEDVWRGPREQTCDVGEALYIEAVESGLSVVNKFPIADYGSHIGASAPYGHVDYDANIYYPTRGSGKYWRI